MTTSQPDRGKIARSVLMHVQLPSVHWTVLVVEGEEFGDRRRQQWARLAQLPAASPASEELATSIFVSYRTEDTVYAVRDIVERLVRRFGRNRVFRDQDSVPLGAQYPDSIRAALQRCDLMLVIIGPHWLASLNGEGVRRIDGERDWVREEVRTAFQRGIPVIPVLLDDTALPRTDQLPSDICKLATATAWRVRNQSLKADVDHLIARIRRTRRAHAGQRLSLCSPVPTWLVATLIGLVVLQVVVVVALVSWL